MSIQVATKRNGMERKSLFTKSKVGCLYKHRAGNYYAVVKVLGKIRRQVFGNP